MVNWTLRGRLRRSKKWAKRGKRLNIAKLTAMLKKRVCPDVAGVILDFMDPCDVAEKRQDVIATMHRLTWFRRWDWMQARIAESPEDCAADGISWAWEEKVNHNYGAIHPK